MTLSFFICSPPKCPHREIGSSLLQISSLSEGTPVDRGVLQPLSWPLAPAGALSSPPVSPLPSPGSCKHSIRSCVTPRGSASPCACPGQRSQQCSSQGTRGDRLEGLKGKHLLLGCPSACSAEVTPTYDFLDGRHLQRARKQRRGKIMTWQPWRK